MSAAIGRLEVRWTADGGENGQLLLSLVNLGDAPLGGFRLVYTSLTRNLDRSMVGNAEFVRRDANYHEFAPPEGLVLKPGETWDFSVGGLTRKPTHITDGISTAYLILADGTAHDLDTGDIMPADFVAEGPGVLMPEGELTDPVGIIPWPNAVALSDFGAPPAALCAASGSSPSDVMAFAEIVALGKRLFPNDHTPFMLAPAHGMTSVVFEKRSGLSAEAYELAFAPDAITLGFAEARGRSAALITLAQMLRAAHAEPEKFRFPRAGTIKDAPRYSWRGCHLDVSRQVYSIESVTRFVDILTWNKMNILHWHLSDDEGWRLEIKSRPELTRAGSRQGPNEKMLPQLGAGAKGRDGFYTQDEVRELVAHAGRLHVDIMPEFDIPGHCTAVLCAYPELADPDERPGNYHSVQGYANNALNPAIEATYDFLADVFREAAALFPFPYVHVGGDEVAHGSWLGSPLAQLLMVRENLSGTMQLQAHMLKKVQEMLQKAGKKLAGWDEVSHGGGVFRDGTLLMAWQKIEVGLDLAEQGYDVVMTPGQAYYLDMAQSDAWLEPGLTWAGIAPPQKTYEFEAVADFPPELAVRMKGVQGCIWSENLVSRQRFNHMVFPRLGAIAEAGWTQKANKNWLRFCAQAPMMPEL
jgi:hexosaminidase